MATPPRQPLVSAQTEDGSVPAGQDKTATQAASAAAAAPAFGPPGEPGEVGRLGPYRIVKELGRGGMGAVYAALDSRLDRRLALKVMLPQFAADAAAKARFLREARAAARIKHDNVITVYEADERDGVPYIAMEFLEGYSLDNYLRKKGNPTIPQVLRMVGEAAAGLAAAHKLGLVHRDVKPANLWLEAPNGRVKVLDFGLARPVDAEAEVTRSGGVVGTPAYMSPEQARGERVDHRTDLFSLGAVLYRLCTGRLPFEGPTVMAVLFALGTQEPRPVRELNPAVPASLAALIHQLLAKKAADRPQTADEVVRRLRTIAQELAGARARPAAAPAAMQPQTAYAPIQVTSPRPEASPFAGIDADVTEYETAAAPAAPKSARKKFGDKTPWMLAGLAGLLAAGVVAGVIIIIKNKDGSETKIEASDGATVTVKGKDGRTLALVGPDGKPPAAASDPDRLAAEYVVSLGGSVRINGLDRDFKAAADLPKGRFTLTNVDLTNKEVTDAALANLQDCKNLIDLRLPGTKVTGAGLAKFNDWKVLRVLDLSGTPVTDAGLVHLKNFPALDSLLLYFTPVTDAGLVHLKNLHSLMRLWLVNTQLTDAGLVHLKNLPALNYLGLDNTAVSDKGLIALKECRALTGLGVKNTKVTAKALADFHAAVPGCGIEHDGGIIEAAAAADPDRRAAEYVVSLGGMVRINGVDREFKAAAELPKEPFKLDRVVLRGPKVTDAGLAAFEGCKGLIYIDLAGAPVTDAGLAHLKAGEGLWLLNLPDTAVTDAGLASFKDCKALGHLHLAGTAVTDAGLAYFKDCKDLGYLSLFHTKVTDAGLAAFKNCKGLTYLGLWSTAVTDAGLAPFQDCKGLTYLNVRKTQVTAKGMEAFHAAVPGCKIEHDGGIIEASDPDRRAAEYVVSLGGMVRINGVDREFKAAAELPKERFTLAWVDLHSPKVTDAGLAAFEGCKELAYISLYGTAVTDAGLAHLKVSKVLWFLSLGATKVTDAGLAQYKDHKGLGHLQLDGTAVTDVGLAYLKDCKGLGYLSLGGTKVTDAGLAYFKDCKDLGRLLLYETAVTDAGLAYFKDCKGLTDLNLIGTKTTDAGLAYFKDCKSLTELDVRKTQVTAKGLEAFHAAVPGCKIEHDGGVIEPKK